MPTGHSTEPSKKLALAIIHFGAHAPTLECVDSFLVAGWKGTIHIICNGDRSFQKEHLHRWSNQTQAEVKFHVCRVNRGYSGACNIGLNKAFQDPECSWAILLNNDTVAYESTVTALHEFVDHGDPLTVYGCTIVEQFEPELIQVAGGASYDPVTTISRHAFAGETASQRNALASPRLDYIYGACLLISRPTFNIVGELDEDYFLYFEELDFCTRCKKEGIKLEWFRPCIIGHAGGSSTGTKTGAQVNSTPFSTYHETRSALLYTTKHYPWLLPFVIPARSLVKILYLLRRRQFSLVQAVLTGFSDWFAGVCSNTMGPAQSLFKSGQKKGKQRTSSSSSLLRRVARKLWHSLPWPQFVRQFVERCFLYPRIRYRTKAATYPPGPYLVVGFLRSGLGIGEAARLDVQALRAGGVEHQLRDISIVHGIEDLGDPQFADSPSPSTTGPILLHVNAPETGLTLQLLGPKLVRNRPIIGFWAWELPDIPKDWKLAFAYLDEIWVPSEFVAQAVRKVCHLPVHVVPHPVAPPPTEHLTSDDFGLDHDSFSFLCLADGRSDLERKNILGVIRAFLLAFKDNEDAQLVVKLHHSDHSNMQKQNVLNLIKENKNIRVIQELYSRGKLGDLMRACDCLVSLHRAEGFGLPMAEAMRLGKPVIATGYSGNLQFMNDENSLLVSYDLVPVESTSSIYAPEATQVWAKPDENHAAMLMKKLVESTELQAKLAKQADESTRTVFDHELFCKRAILSSRKWSE